MEKFVLIGFILLFFVACDSSENKEKLLTIKFNLDENNIPYNDLFKKTDVIFLETNEKCLISQISKIEIAGEKIIILDEKQEEVVVFNEKGKFLNKIGRVGRGPGEFIRPKDFFISGKDSLVKIFDSAQRKLICYNMNGNFHKEINFDDYFHNVGETRNGYWGYCSNSQGNFDNMAKRNILKFKVLDDNGRTNDFAFGDKVIDNLNLFAIYHVSSVDNIISFVEPYSPYIYDFDGSAVSRKYYMDFSGKFPSELILEQCESLDYPLDPSEIRFRDKITRDYPCYYYKFFENRKWILLSLMFKNKILLYNKYSKKPLETAMTIYSDDGWETLFEPIYISEDCIYSYADFSMIQSSLNNSLNMPSKRAEAINKLLQCMKENDNPLILKHFMNN